MVTFVKYVNFICQTAIKKSISLTIGEPISAFRASFFYYKYIITNILLRIYYLFLFINYFSHINYQRLDFIKHHLLNQYSLYQINQLYNTKYFCIIKSSLNNLFISVVNFRGEVILKDSKTEKYMEDNPDAFPEASIQNVLRKIKKGQSAYNSL